MWSNKDDMPHLGYLDRDYQDIMQVCLNGHLITDSYKKSQVESQNYCDICGKETITKCPECGKDIPGRIYFSGGLFTRTKPVPEFCEFCGSPFPWAGMKKEEETSESPLSIIYRLCERFHRVVKQLRKRHDKRKTLDVNDEYDVQDLLHALLRIYFDDIRPEEWTPSYAGGSSRMDFFLKNEKIVIEIKKTRKGLEDNELGKQLIVDIAKYQAHPDCKTLVCFVYDPEGRITNPTGIQDDLESREREIEVILYIYPK